MKNSIKRILIGPHHGEHSFEKLKIYSDLNIKITELGYINEDDRGLENEHTKYIGKQDILPLKDKFETDEYFWKEDLDWGHFTSIEWNLTEKGDDKMQNFYYKELLKTIRELYISAFCSASGDDDTFDYMPSFCDALESILRCCGETEFIKKIRRSCLESMLDRDEAEGMEFFSDEELDTHYNK